jgi:hypothetical protein
MHRHAHVDQQRHSSRNRKRCDQESVMCTLGFQLNRLPRRTHVQRTLYQHSIEARFILRTVSRRLHCRIQVHAGRREEALILGPGIACTPKDPCGQQRPRKEPSAHQQSRYHRVESESPHSPGSSATGTTRLNPMQDRVQSVLRPASETSIGFRLLHRTAKMRSLNGTQRAKSKMDRTKGISHDSDLPDRPD